MASVVFLASSQLRLELCPDVLCPSVRLDRSDAARAARSDRVECSRSAAWYRLYVSSGCCPALRRLRSVGPSVLYAGWCRQDRCVFVFAWCARLYRAWFCGSLGVLLNHDGVCVLVFSRCAPARWASSCAFRVVLCSTAFCGGVPCTRSFLLVWARVP